MRLEDLNKIQLDYKNYKNYKDNNQHLIKVEKLKW